MRKKSKKKILYVVEYKYEALPDTDWDMFDEKNVHYASTTKSAGQSALRYARTIAKARGSLEKFRLAEYVRVTK